MVVSVVQLGARPKRNRLRQHIKLAVCVRGSMAASRHDIDYCVDRSDRRCALMTVVRNATPRQHDRRRQLPEPVRTSRWIGA